MKTVVFIQVLYVLINFETRYNVVNGAEKCESSIETRAVLISCPEKDTGCDDDDPLSKATLADEYRLLQVKPSEMKKVKAEIDREFPSRVTECKRKLVITMKLNNRGKIECDDGFIVIDHVYDPITRGKARLLSPVIIKLRQEQMVQLYPLQFQKVVNSNPNENIFTKETCPLYRGCSVNLDNPTCGITTYNGEPIPFSEGFCCSCDSYVNAVREVLPDKHENAFRYKDPSLFGHQENLVKRSRETRSVVINPHLLNLRAGDRPRARHVSSVEEEEDADPNLVDEQVQTPPNFFFERDRQIVCAPEALLKELCNLDGKDSDGKDDDETNDDDSNSAGSEDTQFKRISGKNQESNGNSEKDDCNEKASTGERKNPKGSADCNDDNNENQSNCNNANTANSSSGNRDSVTDASNGKNTPKESDRKSEKDTFHGVYRYLDDGENDSRLQYHFTGNNKIIALPLKYDNGNIKKIEIVNGKREIANNVIPARHRKKRLTRDNDAYSLSFQFAADARRRRRNKRVLTVADRKISNPKLYEKFNVEAELCAESYPPNCTLPVFFFSHDKSILCPPCIPQNRSGDSGKPDGAEYEDSNLNTGKENDNDNDSDSDSDNLEEAQELEQIPPPPPPPKTSRLHTDSGGTWDVNANFRRGNIFTLDLIKSEDKEDRREPEKIEQISYEQKKFPPDFRDDYLKSKVMQKFKSAADKERLRYRGDGKNMYGSDNKLYGQDQKEKDIGNLMDFADANMKEGYRAHSGRKGSAQYPYNSGNPGNFRTEMKMVVPDDQQNYPQINLDLRTKDSELLRKGSYIGSESSGSDIGYGRGGTLESVSKTVDKGEAAESRNFQRSGTCQNGKGAKSGDSGARYYGGAGENPWKKSYYPQNWASNENDRLDFGHPPGSSGREKIADLLAYNYPRNDETDSQYLVSSKNVFFADSKPHRNQRRKEMRAYEERFFDDNAHETGRDRARQPARDSFANSKSPAEPGRARFEEDPVFYGDEARLAEAFIDRFPPSSKNFDEYNQRNRRRASLSPQAFYSDFDSGRDRNLRKLRNSHLVRKRERRSAGEALKQEPKVKISKWEHRTPPGPEYQFDVSKLTRPRSERPYVYSSGAGDRQRMEDIQKNFAKLKPKPGNRDQEREEAKRERRLKLDRERLIQSFATAPSKFKRDIRNEVKAKRHTKNGRRQERGGQECTEKDSTSTTATTTTTEKSTTTTTTTAKAEQQGDASQESTHCMKLSDLWYSVYLIKRPELSQLVGVQIYDKQTMCDGTTNWRDVTKGYMVRLGSFLQRAEDDVPTISMTFTPTGPNVAKDEPKLDTENYRLLIPSHLTNEKRISFYPEFYGGPSEFMLVRNADVSETGADCNKIGTSFEAFARQPGRCSRPPGSCLKRQPVDLWREDMEARIRGKRGKYFIENFGSVSNTSIKSYSNLTGDYLAMDYYGEYSSVLEIEMRADGNAVIRQGENAQIPMVYVDSMSARKTKIVLSVINMGLTSALFRPRLGECPSNLDPTWCPLEGPLVQIPPQQRHDFKLELSGILPAKKVHCAVEVLNHYNKKVARRRIIIKRSDRCFCAFYCKCICVGGSKKSTCIQLPKEDYNAAGYFDPIPERNEMSASGTEAFLENLKVVAISMAYALFIFGLIKAVLGLFWRRLGTAGVQVIVGPRTLNQYYERDICCYQVVYDECGFPIHPQTCKTVQIVPMWLEMFLNFFFFYLYLLKVIWLLISSIPCCKSMYSDCEVCCRVDESDDETAEAKMNQSGNYSSNYFTYNVITLTPKKTKPEENALHNPYKAEEDPLEEDDTEFVLEEMKRYKHKNADE